MAIVFNAQDDFDTQLEKLLELFGKNDPEEYVAYAKEFLPILFSTPQDKIPILEGNQDYYLCQIFFKEFVSLLTKDNAKSEDAKEFCEAYPVIIYNFLGGESKNLLSLDDMNFEDATFAAFMYRGYKIYGNDKQILPNDFDASQISDDALLAFGLLADPNKNVFNLERFKEVPEIQKRVIKLMKDRELINKVFKLTKDPKHFDNLLHHICNFPKLSISNISDHILSYIALLQDEDKFEGIGRVENQLEQGKNKDYVFFLLLENQQFVETIINNSDKVLTQHHKTNANELPSIMQRFFAQCSEKNIERFLESLRLSKTPDEFNYFMNSISNKFWEKIPVNEALKNKGLDRTKENETFVKDNAKNLKDKSNIGHKIACYHFIALIENNQFNDADTFFHKQLRKLLFETFNSHIFMNNNPILDPVHPFMGLLCHLSLSLPKVKYATNINAYLKDNLNDLAFLELISNKKLINNIQPPSEECRNHPLYKLAESYEIKDSNLLYNFIFELAKTNSHGLAFSFLHNNHKDKANFLSNFTKHLHNNSNYISFQALKNIAYTYASLSKSKEFFNNDLIRNISLNNAQQIYDEYKQNPNASFRYLYLMFECYDPKFMQQFLQRLLNENKVAYLSLKKDMENANGVFSNPTLLEKINSGTFFSFEKELLINPSDVPPSGKGVGSNGGTPKPKTQTDKNQGSIPEKSFTADLVDKKGNATLKKLSLLIGYVHYEDKYISKINDKLDAACKELNGLLKTPIAGQQDNKQYFKELSKQLIKELKASELPDKDKQGLIQQTQEYNKLLKLEKTSKSVVLLYGLAITGLVIAFICLTKQYFPDHKFSKAIANIAKNLHVDKLGKLYENPKTAATVFSFCSFVFAKGYQNFRAEEKSLAKVKVVMKALEEGQKSQTP